MKDKQNSSLLLFISSMLIFGTIGVFRKNIPLASGLLACTRGIIGGLFLAGLILVKKKSLRTGFGAKTTVILIITGILIGFNWIFLFEAYNYTSIAVATLCYYMEPTIVLLMSPIIFKERLTGRKIVCAIIAIVGIAFVSGINGSSSIGLADLKGVIFGLIAAVLYSTVVITNKKNPVDDAYSKTMIQLLAAGIVLIPYVLFTERFSDVSLNPTVIVLILIVGIFHTGFTYALYFGSMQNLKSQTIALLSYIDPVFAIFISAVILREPMTVLTMVGAVMVIGAAIAGEIGNKK